ncbi:MAG: HlyD family secretion protein [Aquirufa sp.]
MYHIGDDIENSVENLIAKNRENAISLYFVFILAIASLLFSLPYIWVDISSQSRGIIRSADENVPLISLVNGKITYLNIHNNQSVKKGEILLKIDPEILESQVGLNTNFKSQTLQSIQDLEQINGSNNPLIIQENLKEDYQKFLKQKTELESKLALAEINFQRNKKLYDERVISTSEYERFLYELTFVKDALNSFVQQQKFAWEKQKKELLDALKNYENSLEKLNLEKKNYVLKAPMSGTIVNFKGFQVNSFIGGASTIAEISPNHGLLVECQVQPKDIGLIRQGQRVKFELDAFNYNQWGFIDGEVMEMDQNVSIQDKEVFFKVRCLLNETHLKLKNGYKAKVGKGMTLTGRFILNRRNLYQLLFDKIDNWLNPNKQANN